MKELEDIIGRQEGSIAQLHDSIQGWENLVKERNKTIKHLESKLKNHSDLSHVSTLLIDFWRELPELEKNYLLPEEQNNMVRDFLKINL